MWLKLLLLVIGFTLVVGVKSTKSVKTLHQSDYLPLVDLVESASIGPLDDPIDGISYRLPNTTIPLSYDIWLSTHLHRGDFNFDGRVFLRFECVQTTSELVLHYRMITITSVALFDGNSNLIQVGVPFRQDDTVEFLVITPRDQLIQGQVYSISIMYNGTMRDDGLGFNVDSYIDSENNTRWWATTLFLPTDGRHAFPW